MPVCKFFVRGDCRKGDYCKFDHVLPSDSFSYGGGTTQSGTSILRKGNTSISRDHFETPSNNVFRQDYQDRRFDGQHVTIGNEYYTDYYSNKQYDQSYKFQHQPQQRYQNDRFHYARQNVSSSQSYVKKPHDISINEVYTLLKSDISNIENSRIWPLTSLCLIRPFGSLEDWVDYSPEEMRLAAYIAKATNNFDGYKEILDKVVSKAQALRDFYKTPSRDGSAKIRAYIQQDSETIHPIINNELDFSRVDCSIVNSNSNSWSDSLNLQATQFLTTPQNQSEDMEMAVPKSDNVFGSATSVFSVGTQSPSLFNSSQKPPDTNIFGGFTQNGPSSFGNVFGKSSNSSFGFGQTVEDNSHTPRSLTSIFPGLEKTDLDTEILALVWHGDSPYSRANELTEEEYEQFKAPTFTIGKVPLVPPSRDLC